MENRSMFIIFNVIFMGVFIQIVSMESFDQPVPCTGGSDCKDPRLPADAHCHSGFCVCTDQEGVTKNCTIRSTQPKSTAGRNAGISQVCKTQVDCNIPNAFCNTTRSQCACVEGYVESMLTPRCLPVAASIGASCEEDEQCQKTMGNTTCCVEKQCVCADDHHVDKNNTKCWKTLDFGDKCSYDQECSEIENAECNKQLLVCGCSENAVLFSGGQKCLVAAKEIFQECVENSQCTKNLGSSDCINNRCECIQNSHFDQDSSQCVSSRKLGEKCLADRECFQDGQENENRPMICKNNTCVCKENFNDEDGKCVNFGTTSSVSGYLLSVLLAILLFSWS